MAAFTHRIATASTTGGASSTSGAFTPTAGDLVVGMVMMSQSLGGGSMTGSANGLTFSLIETGDRANTDTNALFVSNQLVPASPVSMTVTQTCSGAASTGTVIFVATLASMLRAGPSAVRQHAWTKGASGTPAVTMPGSTAVLTGNAVIGMVGNALNPAAMTPPTSFTENAAGDTGHATPVKGAEYAYRDSGHTSATVTWGNSLAAAWSALIAEFDVTAPVPPELVMPPRI